MGHVDRRKTGDVKYIDFSKAFDTDDILLFVPCSISLSFIIYFKNNLEENENLILTGLEDPFKLIMYKTQDKHENLWRVLLHTSQELIQGPISPLRTQGLSSPLG